jgi:hypothetical protein
VGGAGSGSEELRTSKTDTGACTSLAKFGRSESRGTSDGALDAALSPAGAEKMMGLLEGGAPFCAAADKTIADSATLNNDNLKSAGRKFIFRFVR